MNRKQKGRRTKQNSQKRQTLRHRRSISKKPSFDYSTVSLTVKVPVSNKALAIAVATGLKPETAERGDVRSSTKVTANGRRVEMRIAASDMVALRAAANSFMRFLVAALGSIEAVSGFNKTDGAALQDR